jgi:K+-sensing histidine kinase KdpD
MLSENSAHGEDSLLTKSRQHQNSATTRFAPAERASGHRLDNDIKLAANNSFIDGLMNISNGLFAVLNDRRQIVALNDSFIKYLGVEDAGAIMGLRPGESVNCVHACKMPGGCGTSDYCKTCGAAIAIMTALETRQPQERTCAVTVERDNQQLDIFFSVRSCHLEIEDHDYILLFLQDVSIQQYRACLDRTFFHDINNMLCSLVGKSQMISICNQHSKEKQKELHNAILRITQEISIQGSLQNTLDSSYKPFYTEVSINRILMEIEELFSGHPLTVSRTLKISYLPDETSITTDFHLVTRIVMNMVTNALEATPENGSVRLSIDVTLNAITFSVWNAGVIPEAAVHRIFQRNFSTKADMGRGLGTYSMKLFGEQVLGGTVQFESTPQHGTTFRFTHIAP